MRRLFQEDAAVVESGVGEVTYVQSYLLGFFRRENESGLLRLKALFWLAHITTLTTRCAEKMQFIRGMY